MELPVEANIVTIDIAECGRMKKRMIQGGIKDLSLPVGTAIHTNMAEHLIPCRAGIASGFRKIPTGDLLFQV